VLNQILYNRLDIVIGMEAEYIFCLLNAHLVVAEIALVVDGKMHSKSELLLDRHFDQISDFANCVVSRSNIENSRDPIAGFYRTDVCIGRILDTDNRSPNGGVVHRDFPITHAVLKRRMVLTIRSRRIRGLQAGNGPLAQRDDREVVALQVHHSLLALEFGNPVRVGR